VKFRSNANLDMLVMLSILLTTGAMLVLATYFRVTYDFGRGFPYVGSGLPPLTYATVAIIWFVIMLGMGVPRSLRTRSLLDALARLTIAVVLCCGVFAGTLYLSLRETPRLLFVYFSMLDLVALILLGTLVHWLVRRGQSQGSATRRVLIAGASPAGIRLAQAHGGSIPSGGMLVGFLDDETQPTVAGYPVLGTIAEAQQVIEREAVDELIVALPIDAYAVTIELVRQLHASPVHIRLIPDFLGMTVLRTSVEYVGGLPLVGLRVAAISDEQRLLKRGFDMVCGLLLLAVFGLPMALIALLIKLDTPGSAIYRSARIGENGRVFMMYKFRTMVENADRMLEMVSYRDDQGKLHFKHRDDPRVTRIGRFLRRTSLDELPQLFNVILGDMSLVGPRPEIPEIVRDEYEPWQWSRFTVPPGITGWWQITRRGFEHQHHCTDDDLYYIQNYSLWLDIQILFRTVGVVLRGDGAY
jgi:exopolysaccharide biosynthesis polyprenyl glycosylphosphotransferase